MFQKTKLSFIKNTLQCFKLVFKAQPKTILVSIFFTTTYSALWALQTLSMQKFFDSIINIDNGNFNLAVIIFSLIIMSLTYILYHIMDGIDNCFPEIVALKVNKHINNAIFERTSSLNCVEYEDTDRLEFIEKAVNGSEKVVLITLTLLDIIFYYIAYFVFMGWYLLQLKPILVITIFIIFVPCIISHFVRIEVFKKLEEEASPIRRECEYYKKCLEDKDTRILGASLYFETLYTENLKRLNQITFKTQQTKTFINFWLNMLTAIGYALIVFLVFKLVMEQQISLGAFSAVLTSIGNIYRFMNKLISERIGWATENISYVENYLNFLSEKTEKESNKVKPLTKNDLEILLKNVGFSYPMSNNYVLKNINLTIRKNEKIAIVGENGCGKTTLCKIIMGLYEPTYGQIFRHQYKSKYSNISAVFQDYCKYKMTLQENITISESKKEINDKVVEDVLMKAGINFNNEIFNDGINTIIGREFGGIELSGGQWQRLAIARGLYKTCNFIILDEPTAAIDPIEESHLYNNFLNLSEGKTSIIVTHRLGAVKLADRIIVLSNGIIIEEGTHEDLMKKNGKYKKMYESQSQWYKK